MLLVKGLLELKNISRLRIKECDRLKATVEVINQLGGQAKEFEDAMEIQGVAFITGWTCFILS